MLVRQQWRTLPHSVSVPLLLLGNEWDSITPSCLCADTPKRQRRTDGLTQRKGNGLNYPICFTSSRFPLFFSLSLSLFFRCWLLMFLLPSVCFSSVRLSSVQLTHFVFWQTPHSQKVAYACVLQAAIVQQSRGYLNPSFLIFFCFLFFFALLSSSFISNRPILLAQSLRIESLQVLPVFHRESFMQCSFFGDWSSMCCPFSFACPRASVPLLTASDEHSL